MLRLVSMIALMSLSAGAIADQAKYDPILLHSYFTHMRQLHAPLFSAMETYCQTHQWPTSAHLDEVLTQKFHLPNTLFRSTTTGLDTLALQYQPFPSPEWFVTIQPARSKINKQTYFNIQLTSMHKRHEIGVDGIAYCNPNSHLSDIMLLLRDPNQASPASLGQVLEQRQYAELGKTPHLVASYRG